MCVICNNLASYTPTCSYDLNKVAEADVFAFDPSVINPFALETVSPQATGPSSAPVALALNTFVNGEISTVGERDLYAITLEAGKTYEMYLYGNSAGNANSLQDTVLEVYNSTNTINANRLLYQDDGSNGSTGFYLNNSFTNTFTVATTGTYYVSARDLNDNDTGQYSLRVRDVAAIDTPQNAVDWGVNVYDTSLKIYFNAAGESSGGVTSLGWQQYQIDASIASLQAMAEVTGHAHRPARHGQEPGQPLPQHLQRERRLVRQFRPRRHRQRRGRQLEPPAQELPRGRQLFQPVESRQRRLAHADPRVGPRPGPVAHA